MLGGRDFWVAHLLFCAECIQVCFLEGKGGCGQRYTSVSPSYAVSG